MSRWHRLAGAATLLFLLFFAGRGLAKAFRPEGNDFTVYYRTAQAVLAGGNPNRVPKHIYPPAFALAVAPLGWLPYPVAATLWTLLELGSLVYVARRVARLFGSPPPPLLVWGPTACVLRLLDSEFANGQVNLITLALCVAAWEACRRRPLRAGVLAGFAAALKVLPGCLAFYFLVARRYRALGAALLAVALFGLALPTAVWGPARHGCYLAEWWRAVPAPYLAGGRELLAKRSYLPGQSLSAVLYRLLTPTPARWGGTRPHLAAWDPDSVAWLVRAVTLALWLALVPVLGRGEAEPLTGLRHLALVLTTALLTAPLVHKAHMAWALPGYAVVLAQLWGPGPRPLRLAAHRAAFALSVLLVTGSAPGLVGRPLASGLLAHNVVGFGILVLHGQLLYLAASTRGAGATRQGRPGARPSL